MKNIAFQIFIVFQVLCCSSWLFAADLSTHHAYRVTSYNLGSLQDLGNDGGSQYLQNIKPLMITSTTADILNSEHERNVFQGETSFRTSSFSSIALSAQIEATDNISLQGSLGVTRNLWSPDLMGSLNGSSWEANLGVIYKLLNNLSYELHFGYMDTGNLFSDRHSYSDVENIIMISNQLSLSF